jgi:hypothetical protein
LRVVAIWSWSCCSVVYACTVVMKPESIPNSSRRIFAIGATQFVVHEALETIRCPAASYVSSLTPRTIVTSGSVAGAEMITFFAPASRCFEAPSRSVKSPVDSTTRSTPSSPHGSCAGSRSESTSKLSPFTEMEPSEAEISPSSTPWVESYLSTCASTSGSARSLTATI